MVRFNEGIINRTDAQTMLYLTCTTISSVDLAHYGVSRGYLWIVVQLVIVALNYESNYLVARFKIQIVSFSYPTDKILKTSNIIVSHL